MPSPGWFNSVLEDQQEKKTNLGCRQDRLSLSTKGIEDEPKEIGKKAPGAGKPGSSPGEL